MTIKRKAIIEKILRAALLIPVLGFLVMALDSSERNYRRMGGNINRGFVLAIYQTFSMMLFLIWIFLKIGGNFK